jgi:hypothetical protein
MLSASYQLPFIISLPWEGLQGSGGTWKRELFFWVTGNSQANMLRKYSRSIALLLELLMAADPNKLLSVNDCQRPSTRTFKIEKISRVRISQIMIPELEVL